MKKILLTVISTAALLAGVSSSFAQGQLIFNNSGTSLITVGTTNTKVSGPANTYTFGLYMGAFGSTDISQMQLVDTVGNPATTTTSFNTGLFAGGTVVSPGNVANTINFAAGTQYAFIVAGWTTANGSTYAQALASPGAFTGLSSLGFITPQAPPATIPNIFGVGAGQVGGFTLTQAPEPTTIALGGLGAAALLLFRRRK